MIIKHAARLAVAAVALAGCSTVNDFAERVGQENRDAHSVMNQETLLNIARASHNEALDFVALTNVGGTRSEDVKIGFPTITLGPKQSITQKQFVFSGNVLDSNIQGSFQSQPLITTPFQQGMLSPVSSRQMALLAAARGREPVFLAAIDGIDIAVSKWTKTDKNRTTTFTDGKNYFDADGPAIHYFFRAEPIPLAANSPVCSVTKYALDPAAGGSYFDNDSDYLNQVLLNTTWKEPDQRACNAYKFKALLQALLAIGLSTDIPENPEATDVGGGGTGGGRTGNTPSRGSGDQGDKSAARAPQGRLCLDPLLLDPAIKARELDPNNRIVFDIPVCLSERKTPTDSTDATLRLSSPAKYYYALDDEKAHAVKFELTLRMHSPIGLYNKLGTILAMRRNGERHDELFGYTTAEAKWRYGANASLIGVVEDGDQSDCAVDVDEGGASFCVKNGDRSTINILALLQDLRNLNINPSDLSTAFTVRGVQ